MRKIIAALNLRRNQYFYGLILPLLLIVIILVEDIMEGPKTAYVGVLACVAPLAATFGSVRMVMSVAFAALVGAFSIGFFASDGNVAAQNTRLVIISIASALAIAIAAKRISVQEGVTSLAAELAVARVRSQQAYKDYLTGVLNRHGILKQLADNDMPVRSVVMIDLDNFKSVNDVYGHKIGDDYLKAFAGRISFNLKSEDLFGRWGGDEFVVVLPHDERQSSEILERVISQARQTPFQVDEIEFQCTFSAGVAPWNTTETFEAALLNADKALYEAKSRGGCLVVNFGELPDTGANSKKYAH